MILNTSRTVALIVMFLAILDGLGLWPERNTPAEWCLYIGVVLLSSFINYGFVLKERETRK